MKLTFKALSKRISIETKKVLWQKMSSNKNELNLEEIEKKYNLRYEEVDSSNEIENDLDEIMKKYGIKIQSESNDDGVNLEELEKKYGSVSGKEVTCELDLDAIEKKWNCTMYG